jgi:hypothetical protein
LKALQAAAQGRAAARLSKHPAMRCAQAFSGQFYSFQLLSGVKSSRRAENREGWEYGV